jgi:alkaline phosphatase D
VRDQRIAGFAIVAGDKHSFWAGYPSKSLPPQPFEPVGVEFITGSISAQGLAEIAEFIVGKDDALRPLYVDDRADGTMRCALNTTVLHGVSAALALKKTGDLQQARAARNAEVAPHLKFGDFGGHGYATVAVSASELVTEFVCIPRPLERSAAEDGGPLTYRVRHRAKLWRAREKPELLQEIVEGDAGTAV